MHEDFTERFYKLLEVTICDHLPHGRTKICLPITGGLDSRILAGIVSKHRKIDFSFCYWSDNHVHHVEYATNIAMTCEVNNIDSIYIPDNELAEEAWRINDYALHKVTEKHPLYHHALVLAMSLDFLSGGHIGLWNVFNHKRIRNVEHKYIANVRPVQVKWNQYYTKYFHKVCDTVWHDEFVDFCLSIPLKLRMDRWILREALKKYHPELAAIPQDELRVPVDVSDLEYTLRRHWFIAKKHLSRNKECLNRGYARS